MGNFFTSSQIYNDKDLNKQQFIDKFCKAMADSGYVVCDSEESEMSYILRFAEKSKWVAIASESYGEGGQIAQADAGRIAKMLGTYCMNTEVIDSDCAAMSLYSNDGKEADMLLMGRYDDYFGDDNPKPNEKIWAQFLSEGSTWEQFTEILSGNYVFVEDGLAQLAPVIGMDSGNLLFSAEDDVDDESAVFLDFKKAGTKKEKKLTLNAAFKQVFGEALEPLGFKKVKSKYPYYVRVINNEIVQVIAILSETRHDITTVTVLGGIETVYCRKINFSVSPNAYCNYWLFDLSVFYIKNLPSDYDNEHLNKIGRFSISKISENGEMITKVKGTLDDVKNIILPAFNKVKNIDDAAYFLIRYSSSAFFFKKEAFDKGDYLDSNEILLLTAIKDTNTFIQRYAEYLKSYNNFMASINRPKKQYDIAKAIDELTNKICVLNSDSKYNKISYEYQQSNKKYLALANEYKIRNTEILKSFNFGNLLFSAEDDVDDESAVFLDFKKAGNKKKLTINSAFKQVMGEALKPYGFKVIKGKQPYIVRVINNEILHIISFYSKDPDYPFDKAITIVCGIATVYRKRISLDLTPKQNRIWLKCYNNLGIPFMEKNGMTKKRLPSKSCYNSNDPESMIATLKTGAENLIKYVLPVFDEVKDIDSALDFAEDFGQPCYSQMCTEVCNTYSDEDESFLNFLSEKVLSKHYRFLDNYFNDPNFHEWVLNEIEKRKKENTEILRKLGLLSDDESKENSLTPSEKLTLNAAFKQIFGEALEPLGFHVVKSRYPYLVRVINDEILHVISIRTEQAEYPEDKAFSILGGIATVYRRSIDLNANPMENYHWLRNNVTSFYLYSIDTEPDRRLASIMSQFNYFSEVPKSLPCVMKEALEYTKKYMISYMDGIDSLEKCINHLIKAKLISTAPLNSGLQFTSGTSYDDGLIYLKTNYKHHKELWEEIIEKKEDISDEQYNRIKEFYKFFTDDEYIQGLANELERRKQKNLSALENIGIDI